MKNKEIISAFIGSAFFAIPYLALSTAIVPSLIIGGVAYGASELVLSGNSNDIIDSDKDIYIKINKAKKQNKEILNLIPKVDNTNTRKSLDEINNTVNEILDVINKNPKKAKKLDNFFDYYLPVLIKIVNRYDEVENKKLNSKEGSDFMIKADKMIKDTSNAFKTILSSLYQKDIMDSEADMKVYNLMLKADGIVSDNLIMNRGDDNEE